MLRLLAAGAGTARSPAAALRRLLHIGRVGGEAESVAYRMSMLRPPSIGPKRDLTPNSCSLIGRLAAPVRPYDSSSEDEPKAYTYLRVSASSSASSSGPSNFWVTLHLSGELANVSLKHLKYNDLIYVSGFLTSYRKVSPSGERCICYKICVDELNYVLDQNKKHQDDADSINPSSTPSVTPQVQKENRYIVRLRLWQVFFANPYEWWDNRLSKRYLTAPDFKHKDTHKKIWLHPDDPPWVRKQLELLDLEKNREWL